MLEWNRIEPTIASKIDYRTVILKTFKLPDGNVATRAIVNGDGMRAAGVVAITKDKKIIVARQFRPGPEKVMPEIPGGAVEEGEDPETAARRELFEETGYKPASMTFLGEFCRDAYVNGTWYYYLASDCELGAGQTLDKDEFISVELITIDEFIENAKHGNMTDPAAVLAAYDKLKEIQMEGK
jgi:ADP-ribose pyrophosphatase